MTAKFDARITPGPFDSGSGRRQSHWLRSRPQALEADLDTRNDPTAGHRLLDAGDAGRIAVGSGAEDFPIERLRLAHGEHPPFPLTRIANRHLTRTRSRRP
ncbi:hypothetical protein [Sphingomonas abietis]|uniref:Uncharacterized protein n=1 Tax=Sphingomonas abietis TaxID=3012344 RepID=A0ABY7NTJ2_9SPHN|nr:hypothetical protein [Sphingomonas abietis]WBO23761.1 hypothetical protein PBT88_06460 [Sphingomonas abietis]